MVDTVRGDIVVRSNGERGCDEIRKREEAHRADRRCRRSRLPLRCFWMVVMEKDRRSLDGLWVAPYKGICISLAYRSSQAPKANSCRVPIHTIHAVRKTWFVKTPHHTKIMKPLN